MNRLISLFISILLFVPGIARTIVKPQYNSGNTAFIILVDEETFLHCREAIIKYRDALEKEGLATWIVSDDWQNPGQVKKEIVRINCGKIPLEGVVLLGDIPIVFVANAQHLTSAYKMNENKFPMSESAVPSDRFYDDLHLQFDFIARDSIHPLHFYYKLSEKSPQRLAPSFYSARIMYPELKGGDKYRAISDYLQKAVLAKDKGEPLDCFTAYTGYGYYSDCLVSWENERLILQECFPLAQKDYKSARLWNYRMDPRIKYHLLDELQRKELDIIIFHEHGSADKQFISTKMPEWFREVYDSPLFVCDSLIDVATHIDRSELQDYSTYPKVVILDACENGSFQDSGYIAGYYLFNKGNTIVVQGNSRNVLQDRWTMEMIGLLSYGVRVGQWNRQIATLEGHLFGDPTFSFTPIVSNTINEEIVTQPGNQELWDKYLSSSDASLQALALRMLSGMDADSSKSAQLLKIFRKSSFRTVRMEALKLLGQYKNEDFVKAICLGISDEYELIRRNAALYAKACGDPELIPVLVEVFLNDPVSVRVNDNIRSALCVFDLKLLIKEMKRQIPELPIYRQNEVNQTYLPDLKIMQEKLRENLALVKDRNADREQRINVIRLARNTPYHSNVDVYLQIMADEQEDISVRIALAEALGWFSRSYRYREIAQVLREMLRNKKIFPQELVAEIQQTILRLEN